MKKSTLFFLFLASFVFSFAKGGFSSVLYKEYFIFKINGCRYLCGNHLVQKNENISLILSQRGYNLQNKLSLVKNLNPQLTDIDNVEPGQNILIPLKKTSENEFANNESGRILIPFITKLSVKELIQSYSFEYKVEKGDSVSSLILDNMSIQPQSQNYTQAIKLFRYLNPRITDINLIEKGRIINIPDSQIMNQEWYSSLFNPDLEKIILESKQIKKKKKNVKVPFLTAVANTVGGTLQDSGELYIPLNREIKKYNIKDIPFIKSNSMPVLFFPNQNNMTIQDKGTIKQFYKNAVFFSNPINTSHGKKEEKTDFLKIDGTQITIAINYLEKLISQDNSEDQITIYKNNNGYSAPIEFLSFFLKKNIILPASEKIRSAHTENHIAYKDSKKFIREILPQLKCKYNENTKFSFPYKNIQVNTSANIATTPDDKFLIIDFCEFYGDTINAIEKMKFKVVQIKESEKPIDIISDLASKAGWQTIKNPDLPTSINININSGLSLRLPGLLLKKKIKHNKKFIFFTEIDSFQFPRPVLYYLNWLNIETFFIK